MHPEHVFFKWIDTIIDEKCRRLGLDLSARALPFHSHETLQLQTQALNTIEDKHKGNSKLQLDKLDNN